MHKSTITIDVILDPNKIPEQINWQASDSNADMQQKSKAMCLAFWDGADKSALRIDLWTKDMMVDEIHIEMANREFAEIELLAAFAEKMDVSVGIIDVKNYFSY